jgi:hypothetical protein
MFGFKKIKEFQKKDAWEMNVLIRKAVVLGVSDKYIEEEKLEEGDFGLVLLGRALNWAIPSMVYTFDSDMETVKDSDFRKRLLEEDEDGYNQIFRKGLDIINSDPNLEKLVAYNISYQFHLINVVLSEKEAEDKYPGLVRMKKYLAQSTEGDVDIKSPDFVHEYFDLFRKFNEEYGKYGKKLDRETIITMFSVIKVF